MEKQDRPNILQFASAKFYGIADGYARFIEKRQLLDETLWRKFVRVFSECSDIQDDGWRCEYWGKMMRGACMTYSYTHNETLYRTLTQTVQELLAAQYGAQQRDSMLVFRNVDLTEEKQLADKYEVTWSSLVVVDHNADGSEKPVNMTDFAFRNARKSPDKFKAGLARQIDEMLKD